MTEILLRKLSEWGDQLVVRLPCFHEAVVLPEAIDSEGRFNGRLQCPDCRKIYEQVRLEGWRA